jgi:hypothetical protein
VQVLLEIQVFLEIPVVLDCLVHRDHKENLACQDCLVTLAQPVLLAYKGLPASVELMLWHRKVVSQ